MVLSISRLPNRTVSSVIEFTAVLLARNRLFRIHGISLV